VIAELAEQHAGRVTIQTAKSSGMCSQNSSPVTRASSRPATSRPQGPILGSASPLRGYDRIVAMMATSWPERILTAPIGLAKPSYAPGPGSSSTSSSSQGSTPPSRCCSCLRMTSRIKATSRASFTTSESWLGSPPGLPGAGSRSLITRSSFRPGSWLNVRPEPLSPAPPRPGMPAGNLTVVREPRTSRGRSGRQSARPEAGSRGDFGRPGGSICPAADPGNQPGSHRRRYPQTDREQPGLEYA
jgi:hypothetical protein